MEQFWLLLLYSAKRVSSKMIDDEGREVVWQCRRHMHCRRGLGRLETYGVKVEANAASLQATSIPLLVEAPLTVCRVSNYWV